METPKAANRNFRYAVENAVRTMPAAKHLGFDFGRIALGEVEIIQPYRTELTQQDGFLQGGVVGSLADFAAGAAAGTLLPVDWVNMTIDYTLKILTPARGERIIARGRVISPGPLLTVAAADVFSVDGDDETLCAVAFVTLRNVRLPRSDHGR